MLPVVNSLFRTYLRRFRGELRAHYDAPDELQRRTLHKLLRDNRTTAFGKEHGFTDILTGKRPFAAAVPVRDHDAHLPYFERILLRGERNTLTAEPPSWIATTSGTTGAVKRLPLPYYAIRDIYLRGSWLSLAILYAKRPDARVFSSRNLLIGGAYKGIHKPSGLPQADISAIIIRNIPKIMRPFYIPDVELATAGDYETKIERIAQLAAREEGITVLGGVPTWNLPLYRRILELHGGDHMLDVWPHAQVFKHGGVNFEPYREQFRRLFPDPNFVFQEIYNATEGFFAVQDVDRDPGLLLLLSNGIYYEFVPWTDYQAGDYGAAVPLERVRTGETYVMLITTAAGLYRYPMGDLIEFREVNPYRIIILGRTQEFINAFGEDFLRAEAEGALLAACADAGALVRDFTVGPEYITLGERGRHHWLIEFEQAPANMAAFERRLDEEVKLRNYNYAAKRTNNFALNPLHITSLPNGFFRSWLKARGKLGGQHKVPRLANHRRFIDDILRQLAASGE